MLLPTGRAVPLSGLPPQTAMNAIGPERCMRNLAQIARAPREVRKYACSVAEGASPRLPGIFYGMSAVAARTKWEVGDHPACRVRIMSTLPHPCSLQLYSDIFLPAACAERFSNAKEWAVRMPFATGSAGHVINSPCIDQMHSTCQQRRHAHDQHLPAR